VRSGSGFAGFGVVSSDGVLFDKIEALDELDSLDEMESLDVWAFADGWKAASNANVAIEHRARRIFIIVRLL
jgi:hypothetical protein